MRQSIRPYVTTGIAIVGASLIAVTPVAPPAPNVQQRALKLVDYTEYDASQLTSATETNWAGLESILSSSNWTTDPDISQGLSTLFSDLSTGTSNAVTNPLSELTEGLLSLVSGDYGFNAASTAFTAVTDNIESALSSGDYSTALTDFENEGTTVLYAFLNGYPDSVGSGLISPEFGLLTNTADGAATGQIDALAQVSNTIADEVANLGGANLTTDSLPLVTGNLDLSVSLSQILSDLGLGSATSLTINGLLTDLGLSPTGDLIPSLTIGDVLGDLNLSGTSGLSPDQILADLGIGTITGGVYSDPSLSLDQVLADLNIGSITGGVYSDPSLTPDQILADLGIGTDTGGVYSDPGISVNSILGDLGISTTPVSLSTLLGSLGLTGSATLSISEITNLLGNPSLNLGITTVTLSQILTAADPNGISINIGSLVTDVTKALGLSGTVSIDQVLADLGIGTDTGGVYSDPNLGINDILSTLGLSGTSPIDIGNILGDPTLNINDILSTLGISPSATLNINDILSTFGLNTNSPIPLPSVSIDGLLGDLGINPNENLLTLLGIPNALTLNPTIDLDGGPVATYIDDLAKDLLALVGSSSSLSSDLPSLLGTDPTFNLEPVLSSLLSDLGVPATIDGTLSVDLTNVLAELLPTVF